ncbi:Lariat debranching enzyme [Nakaseomyces glabratus]|uniref:Lariat debranching enzyme n=1 Tax=Candida glabrata TaxID=5478 RepID=A0A0W0CJ62_CANGB|nr:Lariat debranching enzyme [Nakaseomyces glabratus]KTB00996.1 Lariat debranching enzyme [Nakaseomyces glabratus]KTB03772.1 Lariat debranching enzyme [Nakaseomyces glabratus]KTB21977.1 Lariat debranching enzyme [Nakaseomyces glabratus]
MNERKLRIAVQGCCHGELNKVFATVADMHKRTPIDLIIILGDFQSIRDNSDFQSISIPPKYQKLGDFHAYYENDYYRAPVFTIVIGGNHESMRHLMQLPYGGYLANNIYYMGYSGVVWFKGFRIAALSGIWKEWDFEKKRPSWKFLEENNKWKDSVRQLYHIRKDDVAPLFALSDNIDICLSHDWPSGVVHYGNVKQLLKYKPFFEKDIKSGKLGNPIAWKLLTNLKPRWWFSAHLHVKYEAEITHNKRRLADSKGAKKLKSNSDEIELNLDDESSLDLSCHDDSLDSAEHTRFLSLDKCMPRRKWLEIVEIEKRYDSIPQGLDCDKMYWDPSYIIALQNLEKQSRLVADTPFNEIIWSRFSSGHIDDINWHKYEIPKYESGLQRDEASQTNYFLSKHMLSKGSR